MNTPVSIENIESLAPDQALGAVLEAYPQKLACITCSFQAEDMIALDLLRKRIPSIPVLFLDTGYHFAQTYEYRDRMVKEWSLNLVNVVPQKTVKQQESQFGILYRSDPTKCCELRKVEPLLQALRPYELWFTGLRREQSPTRKNLKKIEEHRLPSGELLLKVSLLADWTWAQVWEHTSKNRISCLPQYDQGYLSIGCEPCTAVPEDPNNPRSGRWGGKKLECGIHTFSRSGQ
ncbi:MAG TPA: phosphoadenylyl-sulfate reductase [Verrucomicrobiae bacterium]|nr:phosphoadenylyl-sulfate reductase [Verrucomicrobiae bacterium]